MRVVRRRHEEIDAVEHVGGAPGAVGDECEAFLAGRFVPYRWPEGSTTPVWTWLNETAHAAPEHVLSIAAREIDAATPVPERTRTLLARALVAAGPVDRVRDRQRRVLVPLELELVGETLTPRRLVELVGRALYA